MTLPTDPAHDQVSAPSEQGQMVATRPRLTLSATAEACAVSRSTLRRRLAQGAFPHAVRDADGAWTVPVGDLLAAGLRVHPPRVAGAPAPPVVSRVRGSVPRLPAGAGAQGHGDAGERVLATRVIELEQALAVEWARREGAERLAAERAARIEDLRVSLRMLESALRTGAGGGDKACRWSGWHQDLCGPAGAGWSPFIPRGCLLPS